MAPCDIMDEHEEMDLPVQNGFHLDKDIVGKNYANYDSVLVLSHFKGHAMAGLGGALKNISIGIASTQGKAYIHTAGVTTDAAELWSKLSPRITSWNPWPTLARPSSPIRARRIWYTSMWQTV